MGWVVNATPRVALPPGMTRYSPYRRLGGRQGRSGCARKISAITGVRFRTVQHLASRYTDRAIPAHIGMQVMTDFVMT